MDPVTLAALIGGGASLLGSGGSFIGGMLGRDSQAAMNSATMSFNSYQAQLQREWQEHMASTGYQRAMTDMKNAGLNPILAATYGPSMGGSGSSASISPLPAPGMAMMEGISSASRLGKNAADVFESLQRAGKDTTQSDLNKATESLQMQLSNKAEQDTATSAAQAEQAKAQTRNLDQGTLNAALQNAIIGNDVITSGHSAAIRGLEADAARKYGPGGYGPLAVNLERIIGTILRQFEPGAPTQVPSPSRPSLPGGIDPGRFKHLFKGTPLGN